MEVVLLFDLVSVSDALFVIELSVTKVTCSFLVSSVGKLILQIISEFDLFSRFIEEIFVALFMSILWFSFKSLIVVVGWIIECPFLLGFKAFLASWEMESLVLSLLSWKWYMSLFGLLFLTPSDVSNFFRGPWEYWYSVPRLHPS